MPEVTFHARSLRAIGQDLEDKGINQFNLKSSKYGYLVHALGAPKEGLLRSLRRNIGVSTDEKNHAPARFIYSLETIDQLDDRGRAKRGVGEKLPDFFSLSQCLRAIGAVIDAKRGQLVELSRNAEVDSIPSVVVRYLTLNGSYVSEEHSAPALYDRSVHLYKSRRPESDASDDFAAPTQQSH
jgi:hypothetical protein